MRRRRSGASVWRRRQAMRRSPTVCSATPSITTMPRELARPSERGAGAGDPGRGRVRACIRADVLCAYTVGLEVAGKLGRAFGDGHYLHGWHATATVGVFAATAAAGRLLGLSVDQLRRAFGIAASESSGLVRNFGTMTKPFHAGHAAKGGVIAAMLAKQGFTADASIFDGKDGFLSIYGGGDGQPLGELLDRLAQPWENQTRSFLQALALLLLQPPVDRRPAPDDPRTRPEIRRGRGDRDRFSAGFRCRADRERSAHRPAGEIQHRVRRRRPSLDGKVTLESFTDRDGEPPGSAPPDAEGAALSNRRFPAPSPALSVTTISRSGRRAANSRCMSTRRPGRRRGRSARTSAMRSSWIAQGVSSAREARTLLDMLLNCRSLADVGTLVRATVKGGT